jgi:hypothetical protein
VNLLVHFDPTAICDLPSTLVLAPLPARKDLWEAKDEYVWKVENEREASGHFALAASGDLLRLEEGQLFCQGTTLTLKEHNIASPSLLPSSWEEWCAGMDAFGGLIMVAATLVG